MYDVKISQKNCLCLKNIGSYSIYAVNFNIFNELHLSVFCNSYILLITYQIFVEMLESN